MHLDSDINELIGNLRTRAGRAVAAAKALERGIAVNDKHRLDTVDYYMSIGDYDMALKLCRTTSEAERVMGRYKRLNRRKFERDVKFMFAMKLLAYDQLGMTFEQRGLEAAQEMLKDAETAEAQRRVRYSRNRYRDAVSFLMLGTAYAEAYQLAVRRGFDDLAKEAYATGIKVLEKTGRFGDCATLTEVSGHTNKTPIYRNLDELLNAA